MIDQGKGFVRPHRPGEKGERTSNPSRMAIRQFLWAAAPAVMGLGVLGFALLTPTPAASAPPQVLEYKFADVQPAQGIYGRYEVKFGKLMAERTGGAVKIAHFGGGSLGGEKDVMEGLRLGSVHISLIGLTLMPFLDVIWGPYVFRDNDHGRKVLDGEIGQSWKERVIKEGGGLRLVDYVYFGPRQLTTKNTPGKTPKELKGLKIRVMEAPIYIATWKALGARLSSSGLRPGLTPTFFKALRMATDCNWVAGMSCKAPP